MPNSASDLAASFMMSRSESLPMTMETRGLLAIDPNLLFFAQMLQPTRGDVFAIVHAVEADLHYRVVGALDRFRQVRPARSHTQHTAACGVVTAVAPVGSGMKHLYPVHAVGVFNTGNEFARFKRAGVSA